MVLWLFTGLTILFLLLLHISNYDLSRVEKDDQTMFLSISFMLLGPVAIIPATVIIKDHYDN